MRANVRAAVAAAALAHGNGMNVSSVFDYGAGSYWMIEARFTGNSLSAYDYTSTCHFDGTLPDLYHYGQSAHVEFKAIGHGRYDGYDYGSSCFWEATVRGSNVEVYDYGVGAYFTYST
jgi:hypothetical protein